MKLSSILLFLRMSKIASKVNLVFACTAISDKRFSNSKYTVYSNPREELVKIHLHRSIPLPDARIDKVRSVVPGNFLDNYTFDPSKSSTYSRHIIY
jgi:hypothetical protein